MPALCQGPLCWVHPLPQGNELRAVAASKAGEVFAVGDHGVVLRSRGSEWEAFSLPQPPEREQHLRALHVAAADDVWVVGERGILYRFNGSEFIEGGPRVETETFIAVWASSPSDVWAVAAEGRTWHFDGSGWTESLSAEVKGVAAKLIGMWASGPDDVWVLGNGSGAPDEAFLWHYDGTSWAAEPVTLASIEGAQPGGAPVAISGAVRGEPILAFEYRVVARSANGKMDDLEVIELGDVAYGGRSPNTGLLAQGTEVWVASGNGLHRANGTPIESRAVEALGPGSDGRPLAVLRGGRIVDPLAPSHERLAIDTGEISCAPAGEDVVCIDVSGDSIRLDRHAKDGSVTGESFTLATPDYVPRRLTANASGSIAVFSSRSVAVRDGGATRTMTLPWGESNSVNDVIDVALMEDGQVYMLGARHELYVAAKGATTFTPVPLDDASADIRLGCTLLRPTAASLVVACDDTAGSTGSEHTLTLLSADGKLLKRAALMPGAPGCNSVALTASGTVFCAASTTNGGLGVYRLDGLQWEALDSLVGEAKLATVGEALVAYIAMPSDREFGAALHVVEAGQSRTVRLPTHGIVDLAAMPGRVLGERGASSASNSPWPTASSSFFIADL